MVLGHEVEGGGVPSDLEVPAGIVEPKGVRAVLAGGFPKAFGGAGPWPEAPAGAKPLAQDRAPHFLERVTHGVAIDAEAKAHVLCEEYAEIG
jgi:hypothetical protein